MSDYLHRNHCADVMEMPRDSHLTRRKADMVITDDPTTNNASADLARDTQKSTRCLGTLSPKKTTYNRQHNSDSLSRCSIH